jgi:hypothetical protein
MFNRNGGTYGISAQKTTISFYIAVRSSNLIVQKIQVSKQETGVVPLVS